MRKVIPILILFIAACGTYRSEPERGVVTLEVGLDYLYGGVQPVARQEFYLLKGNLIDLLGGDSKDPRATIKLWDLTAFVTNYESESREKLSKILQEHASAKAKTDLQGKTTFAPVAPGTYYIVGWSIMRKEYELIVWNYRSGR